jgi:hypothetical protein
MLFGNKTVAFIQLAKQELLMRKWWLCVLLAAWMLSACSSAENAPSLTLMPGVPGGVAAPEPTETFSLKLPTKTAPPTQAPEPTATTASTQAAEPIASTASTQEPLPVSGEAMPGCTAKSLFPTPNPTLEALFPTVSGEDWVRGPETASVTLIEYSDFQ